jgi:formate transporter
VDDGPGGATPGDLSADEVPLVLAREGRARLQCSFGRILVLALVGGSFVTFGCLLSVLLSTGVEAEGLGLLLAGLGFSAGYYFIALSGVVLFTEANVTLPDVVLAGGMHRHLLRFWVLAFVGNFVAAIALGWALHLSQRYSPGVEATLEEIVAGKLEYRDQGGAGAWAAIVVSAALANWVVGLAFFFARMSRTVSGKYLPLALAVILFEAANLQHSPANMGYFGLLMPGGEGPGWATAMAWSILPAAIGNVVGGALLLAVPFWYVSRSSSR